MKSKPENPELEVAKRNQDSKKGAAITNTASPLGNVIRIDDERIKSYLDRVVRGKELVPEIWTKG